MKNNKNLKKLLNLHYLKYANKTVSCGEFDMPALYCNIESFPDYIALYGNVKDYHKTERTAISFFQFDDSFDGKKGLFWAIYYNDKERLKFFKERFKGVKYIITPDYSILGDIHYLENLYRIFKARIVAIWFIMEIGAIAIPNVSFSDEKIAKAAISGLEQSSVVAISTKGHIQDPIERERLANNVRIVVDALNLKTIILYDVCGNEEETKKAFTYATERGIELIIPPNSLKERNIILGGKGDVA